MGHPIIIKSLAKTIINCIPIAPYFYGLSLSCTTMGIKRQYHSNSQLSTATVREASHIDFVHEKRHLDVGGEGGGACGVSRGKFRYF